MQKDMIDKWFSTPSNLKELKLYTTKALRKANRQEDPSELISLAYLYILGKEIDDSKGNIESLSKGYIKGEIFKTNSSYNRTKRKYIFFEDNELIYSDMDILLDDTIYDIDLITSEFIDILTLHEKGIWNIFYTKRMNKCALIMKYMNISMVGASSILKEGKQLEERFRDFVKNKIER